MSEECLTILRLSTPVLPQQCIKCRKECKERDDVANLQKFINKQKEKK